MTSANANAIELLLSVALQMHPSGHPVLASTFFETVSTPQLVQLALSKALQTHPPSKPVLATAVAQGMELSLFEAVQVALQRNTGLLQSRAARVAERFDLDVAKQQFIPIAALAGNVQQTQSNGSQSRTLQAGPSVRWGLPTGAQLTYSWAYNQTAGSGSAATSSGSGSSSHNWTLSQPLLKGAGFRVAGAPLQLAQWQEQIYRLRQRALVASTISDVVTSYRALQRAVRAREIAATGAERAADLLRTNEALVQAGRLAVSELLQTQADQATQQFALAQAGLSETTARLALAALLRLDKAAVIHPSDSLTPPALPVLDATGALALALESQPEYQQSMLALQQAELQRDVAANAQLADVSLTLGNSANTANSSSTTTNSSQGGSRATTIGVLWTVPLNDLSAKRAYVQAQSALEQSQLALQQSRLQIEQAVYQSLETIKVLQQQLELSRIRLDLSQRKLALEVEKFKVGRSSNFQVLSFQADLRQAELGELDAVLDYMNVLTTLDRLQGTTLQTWRLTLED